MTLTSNQFAILPVQGQVDLQFNGSVVSARVYTSESAALVAGQAVKLVNTAGGTPEVTALTSNSDTIFGFVTRNFKDASFAAGSALEIGLQGTVIWMTAGAAIARGAGVEVVYSTNKVISSAGTNPVVGFAYDKAAADGDLIRVFVQTPKVSEGVVALTNVVTLAEVNAGKTLVAVPAGKKAIVTNFIARSAGAFGALTSIDLLVGATNVASLAQAQLTSGAVLVPGDTGVTLGAGFGIAGADGADITVGKTGSAGTTATSVTFTVSYQLIDA